MKAAFCMRKTLEFIPINQTLKHLLYSIYYQAHAAVHFLLLIKCAHVYVYIQKPNEQTQIEIQHDNQFIHNVSVSFTLVCMKLHFIHTIDYVYLQMGFYLRWLA